MLHVPPEYDLLVQMRTSLRDLSHAEQEKIEAEMHQLIRQESVQHRLREVRELAEQLNSEKPTLSDCHVTFRA